MIKSAGWKLQKALFDALSDNSQITTLLGGNNIFDSEPANASCTYLLIDAMTTKDWSTFSETGNEYDIRLIAYSLKNSRKDLYRLIDAVFQTLPVIPQDLDGHRLVNLRLISAEIRRIRKGVHNYRGEILLRAITELTASNEI